MKLLTKEQMSSLDRIAIQIGIPSILLMENAAISVVNEIIPILTKKSKIGVFCGKGNNGGDGFAIARHLNSMGYDTHIITVFPDAELLGDALINFEAAKNIGVPMFSEYDINTYDLIVDAIFGIGISGVVQEGERKIINEINNSRAYVIAVDIPSGIDANLGEVCGVAIRANKTVTFGFGKIGLYMYPAKEYVGEVVVADISIPTYAIDFQAINHFLTDDIYVKNNLPPIPHTANKGTMGRVFALAGSIGLTGAAYLCCSSALRTGAGLVTLGIPRDLNGIMEIKLTEVMTLPLECDGYITPLSVGIILEHINKCDVLMVGPGIGNHVNNYELMKLIINSIRIPIVIDADGINGLCENINILQDAKAPIVLTPHPGELARLLGCSIAQVEEQRIAISRGFATHYGVTLVLKGAATVIALPDGSIFINPTGNAGMATGGSGDVLTGIISALIARGMSSHDAAICGVYIHGLSGDIMAEQLGEASLLPTDIIEGVSIALKQLK